MFLFRDWGKGLWLHTLRASADPEPSVSDGESSGEHAAAGPPRMGVSGAGVSQARCRNC